MNNPYQMPAEAPTPTKPALPGVYKAIAIIFIVFGGFGILVCRNHHCALAREGQGRAMADARARTGNNGNFVLQASRHGGSFPKAANVVLGALLTYM